jgi:hypothetical protein
VGGLTQDAVEVGDEPARLLVASDLRVGEAEGANPAGDQRFALGGSTPDRVVLHEHHPVAPADVAQPGLVGEPLADLFAVDVGHRVDGDARRAQRVRDDPATEAAIDEEPGASIGSDYPARIGRLQAAVRVATRITSST